MALGFGDLGRIETAFENLVFVQILQGVRFVLALAGQEKFRQAEVFDAQELQGGVGHGVLQCSPEVAQEFFAHVLRFQPDRGSGGPEGLDPQEHVFQGTSEAFQALEDRYGEERHRGPSTGEIYPAEAFFPGGLAEAHGQRSAAVAPSFRAVDLLGGVEMPQGDVVQGVVKKISRDPGEGAHVEFPDPVSLGGVSPRDKEMSQGHQGDFGGFAPPGLPRAVTWA